MFPLGALVYVVMAISEHWGTLWLEQMKNAPTQDPALQRQMVQFFQSVPGMAVALVFLLGFLVPADHWTEHRRRGPRGQGIGTAVIRFRAIRRTPRSVARGLAGSRPDGWRRSTTAIAPRRPAAREDRSMSAFSTRSATWTCCIRNFARTRY